MVWVTVPDIASVEMGWLAHLIDSIGTPNMDFAMLSAVNVLVPVEEISGYLVDTSLNPFGSYGRRADSLQRAKSYALHHHKQDPLIQELRTQHSPGLMLVRVDQASRIQDTWLRWNHFDEPGFRSRVSFVRTNPNGWSMINFFLTCETPDDRTLSELMRFSVAAFPVARRHFQLPDWELQNPGLNSAARLETKLAEHFPTLTPRERSVCAFTMLGRNSREIAMQFNITPATVLTYRRRAYERLGISSAAQLLGHLI